MNKVKSKQIRRYVNVPVIAFSVISSLMLAHAAKNDLPAQAPLFAAIDTAAPNIMVTLADSGAMMADVNQLYGLANDLWHQTINMESWAPSNLVPFEERYTGIASQKDVHRYSIIWRSSTYNQLYYNPEVQYRPWMRPNTATGSMERMPLADPVCAKRFPDGATGNDNVIPRQGHLFANTPCVMMRPGSAISTNVWVAVQIAPGNTAPARYYRYVGPMPPPRDGQPVTLSIAAAAAQNPRVLPDLALTTAGKPYAGLFERVDIVPTRNSYPKGVKRTDCTGSSCTYTEEIQNFANWYMYHRSRINAARAGIAEVMAGYDGNVRVGFATTTGEAFFGSNLNPYAATSGAAGLKKTTNIDGFATPFIKLPIRDFTGKHKRDFYFELFNRMDIGYANVASVVDTVGRYFQLPLNNRASPWLDKPGSLGGKDPSVCRRSYHIVSTEGGWNDDGSYHFSDQYNTSQGALSGGGSRLTNGRPAVGNLDASLAPIFRDAVADTIADLMTYYYVNDLQPALDNSVKPSKDEIRNGFVSRHQRLTTFGLSFGLPLSFDMEQRKQQITDNLNQTVVWQSPYAPPAGSWHKFHRINDIAHGTLNTGGELFGGNNTDQVTDALGKILTIATTDGQSEPRYARSSDRIDKTDGVANRMFDTIFINDGQWHGDVKLYDIDKTGTVTDTGLSGATQILNRFGGSGRHTLRNVWTSDPYLTTSDKAVKFTASTLSNMWKADLLAGVAVDQTNLIAYLRGETTLEKTDAQPAGQYRDRKKHLLGDIVNSLGVVVANQSDGWSAWESTQGIVATDSSSYAKFLEAKKTIAPHLYVGANDGMFHIFNLSGDEVFAYIPKVLRYALKEYASLDYEHRFYVDGEPTLADAKINGWQRVVLSPLGAGGRGLFALNATNSANPKVMWDIDDSDLKTNSKITAATNIGYIQGGVKIDRTGSEGWVAITGNGYDVPANGVAYRQPALLIFDLEKGRLIESIPVGKPTDYNGANGLGAVATLVSQDRAKSQVDAAYAGDLNGNLWRFDLRGAASTWRSKVTLIAQSKDAKGRVQPIAAAPVVASYPEHVGVRLFWGTGSYLTLSDHEDTDTINTIYGVWDKWDRKSNTTGFTTATRADLAERKLTRSFIERLGKQGTDYELRQLDKGVDNDRGWFIDLAVGNKNLGERVVYKPRLVPGNILIINSMTPSGDTCEGGIENRTYVLDVKGRAKVFDATQAITPTGPVELLGTASIELKDNAMPRRPEALMLSLASQTEKDHAQKCDPSKGICPADRLSTDCPLGSRPVELGGLPIQISCVRDGLTGWLQIK